MQRLSQRRTLFALLALGASMTACSTTGPNPGIIPAPNFTRGELVDGTYYARDHSFSIGVPHAIGTYEYEYLQIEEVSRGGAWAVSFGPAGLDETIFRVDVADRDPSSMAVPITEFAEPMFDRTLSTVEAAFGADARHVTTEDVVIGVHPAVFSTYVQSIPEQTRAFAANVAAETHVHAMYLVDYGPSIATLWITIPVPDRGRLPAIEAAVRAGEYEPVKCFVESLQVPAPPALQ